ncbi:aminoglycoside phosphotransferase family protein [Fodinisporobacter ferrooxydans]|uniref:Aminoglycoside phosphotransferase family protein n=1 Tax=Fodinisporobacter ferrooxydans TaxID=2901836 RepID=A0ABY4CG91_9BACL|nr:aminoglycoside phosphotransferase family protein [Alicyclobacillaceae bacterium MYW30-H2]
MIHFKNQVQIKFDGTYIHKVTRSENEGEVLRYLTNKNFPVPRFIRIERLDDCNSNLVMEYIHGPHLEVCPSFYERAFALIVKIHELSFKTNILPITTNSIYASLMKGPDLKEICEVFLWPKDRILMIAHIWQFVDIMGPASEPVIFSHGDYHPRNIIIRDDDVIAIDWENAGYHSIFQDLYTLIHACYPDKRASLLPKERARLFHLFSKQYMDSRLLDGYRTFYLLNRLLELVYISDDLKNSRREEEMLRMQGETVFYDLFCYLKTREIF